MFHIKSQTSIFCISIRLLLIACWSTYSWQFAFTQDSSEPDSTDVDIGKIVSNLDKNNPDYVRLAALDFLFEMRNDRQTLKTVSAIKGGLIDENDEIRYKSLSTMALTLAAHGRECPVELLEMVDDPSEKVQTNYRFLIDIFDSYPPDAFAVAQRLYEEADEDSKANLLPLIGKTGKKDRRALKILLDAVSSEFADRRGNGTVGLWAATKDLELVLPLYFERINDRSEMRSGKREFRGEHASVFIELGALGVAETFLQNLKDRPDEFLGQLKKFAYHRNDKLRRDCATYISTCLEITLDSVSDKEKPLKRRSAGADYIFSNKYPQFFDDTSLKNEKKKRRKNMQDLSSIAEIGQELSTDSDKHVADHGTRILEFCRQIEQLRNVD